MACEATDIIVLTVHILFSVPPVPSGINALGLTVTRGWVTNVIESASRKCNNLLPYNFDMVSY